MLFGKKFFREIISYKILTKKHSLEQRVRNTSSQKSDLLTAT